MHYKKDEKIKNNSSNISNVLSKKLKINEFNSLTNSVRIIKNKSYYEKNKQKLLILKQKKYKEKSLKSPSLIKKKKRTK